MASGFVAVVSLRKNSLFQEFVAESYNAEDYDEQAAIFLDDAVASSNEAIEEFVEQTFESGNVGSLRDRLTRSFSVGDLVVIEHVRTGRKFFWACDKEGWSTYAS